MVWLRYLFTTAKMAIEFAKDNQGLAFTHRLCLVSHFLLSIGIASGIAQTRVYEPVAPAGANSTLYAAPRDDWFRNVQEKFSRYSGRSADIIFDGDSITNRWESVGKSVWNVQFSGRTADFAIDGDRIENLLWRLSKGQVTGMSPRLIVLLIGTNNLARNTPQEISTGVEAAVLQYEAKCPTAHIVLMAIFPRGQAANDGNRTKIREINQSLAERFGGQIYPRVSFLDIGDKLTAEDGSISPSMMPDMLHPTLEGYRIWAEALQPFIDKYAPLKDNRIPELSSK